eukprot:g11956.t1
MTNLSLRHWRLLLLSLHVGCILDYARGSAGQTEHDSDEFFRAISSGDYQKVENLIVNQFADVNMRNMYQETPLHVSALSNKQVGGDILQLLLHQGADPNAETSYNYDGHTVVVRRTPLHWYVHSCDHQGIKLLLLHGADERMKTEEDDSSIDIVEKIIDHNKEEPIPDCEIALKYLELSATFRRKKKKLKAVDFDKILQAASGNEL